MIRTVLGQLISAASRERVALARVVAVTGSSPCPPGTAMVITVSGEVMGCLSGGCIDADVVARAADVIEQGTAQHVRFGMDDPFDLGAALAGTALTCGGEIEVFIEPVDAEAMPMLVRLHEALTMGLSTAWVTEVGPRPSWRVGAGVGQEATLGDESRFVQEFAAAPRMILAGANAFVESLCQMAIAVDYRVTVVDARATFATADRFPGAEVIVDWPQRYLRAEVSAGRVDARTVVCVMSHDARFDVPTLAVALASAAGFVGALGSRNTQADRELRLQEAGVDDAALARLHSPLGLDLNARTPAQTAVSILAQIIAVTGGGSGGALEERAGAIHR